MNKNENLNDLLKDLQNDVQTVVKAEAEKVEEKPLPTESQATNTSDKAAIVIAGLILIGGGIAVGIFVAAWWGRFLISPFLIFAGIMAMKEINNNNNNEGDKHNG